MLKLIFPFLLATAVYGQSTTYSVPLTQNEMLQLSKLTGDKTVFVNNTAVAEQHHNQNSGNSDLTIAMEAIEKGDFKTAFVHFKSAAEQGNVIAQQNLAVLYNNGIGVKQDRERAAYWIEKSGEGSQNAKVAIR